MGRGVLLKVKAHLANTKTPATEGWGAEHLIKGPYLVSAFSRYQLPWSIQTGDLTLGSKGRTPSEIVGFGDYYISAFFSGEVGINNFHQI